MFFNLESERFFKKLVDMVACPHKTLIVVSQQENASRVKSNLIFVRKLHHSDR